MFVELIEVCCSHATPVQLEFLIISTKDAYHLKGVWGSKSCVVSEVTLRKQLERECVGDSPRCAPFKLLMLVLKSRTSQLSLEQLK